MELIEQVADEDNLRRAFARVKANRGASGIDGQSIASYEANLGQNLEELSRLLSQGRYQPPPVKRVYIPKPRGGKRPLGIPTVADRVAQQAVLQVIYPLFEETFSDCSYGFRAKRSPIDAVRKVEEYLSYNHWVVDCDIEDFFDTVDHSLLLYDVSKVIKDKKVFLLIKRWLKSGVLEEGKVRTKVAGTPQGGVISPLLANIYLTRLDKVMEDNGLKMVRYADDFVILCRRRWKAQLILELVEKVMQKLRLTLNPDKTRVVNGYRDGFTFLGYRFKMGYKSPRPEAVSAFKDKVRGATRRQQPKKLDLVITGLNPIIRGWGNYYRYGDTKELFRALDKWIRMRLRCFLEKKRAHLNQNQRLPISVFNRAGLISLIDLKLALAPCDGGNRQG
jgi:RNA-directed DNA polymerase